MDESQELRRRQAALKIVVVLAALACVAAFFLGRYSAGPGSTDLGPSLADRTKEDKTDKTGPDRRHSPVRANAQGLCLMELTVGDDNGLEVEGNPVTMRDLSHRIQNKLLAGQAIVRIVARLSGKPDVSRAGPLRKMVRNINKELEQQGMNDRMAELRVVTDISPQGGRTTEDKETRIGFNSDILGETPCPDTHTYYAKHIGGTLSTPKSPVEGCSSEGVALILRNHGDRTIYKLDGVVRFTDGRRMESHCLVHLDHPLRMGEQTVLTVYNADELMQLSHPNISLVLDIIKLRLAEGEPNKFVVVSTTTLRCPSDK